MVLAAEFAVDGLGFVFPSDEVVVADAEDTAYVACFGEDGFDVFLCLQDCFADYVLVGFELGWDVDYDYVADDVEGLGNFGKQIRGQFVLEGLG